MHDTRPLVDLIDRELEEVAKHQRNRASAGEPPLTLRTQASMIAYAVESFLRTRTADLYMEKLFPKENDE